MNKIKFLLVAAVIMITSGAAMAQKSGYIRVDDVVRLMPDVAKIQPALDKFNTDSLQPRFNYTLSEYQRKDSVVNGKDSLKTPASVRAKMRQEMMQDMQELQNWQQLSQQAMQGKQDELLEPIYARAVEAIQQVAKENGYAYVYSKDALLVAPPADDLLPLVAKKLNLKLPANTNSAVSGPSAPSARKK